ncbi:hypothetical protein [Paracoccus siganidrum]|uniref:Uncharacterized protein n=1 Tax=Paracoccus siganidrum TaxID=1276757 RepID=A0A419A3Z8_9RHOB|nr:hypothetical protein [Paracoccus siganidrum]RJL08396.1 hypothetical protein D3P05_16125 [Paracoccus siganidrum]RMC39308.1 hypothetical protein C9E82_04840 [Paracoccus siganidrum]
MQTIVNAAMPHLLEMLGLVLTGVITWAAAKARQKWGIDIEARHRESLHSALMSGAQMAAAGNLSFDAAIRIILEHVRNSVPDALAALTPSGATLRNLAEAKLAEAQAEIIGRATDALTAKLRDAGAL